MTDSTPRNEIHVVSVQTSSEQGGAEYANVELLAALQERGVDVTLVSDQPALARGTDVPVVGIDLGPKIRRSTARRVALCFPYWLMRLARQLRRESRPRPIDVLLVHFKKEQLMSALLPRRLTGAVVWAEWGPLPKPLTTGPAKHIYRLAARRAELIVGVSEGTRRSLVQAGVPTEKITVISNIVDGQEVRFCAESRRRYRRAWSAGEDTFVIGCVSRLNAAKRNDVIIEALRHLPEDVMLVFAGEGTDEERLRELARPFGPRVRFLPTPRGYVHEVLSGCDLVVFAPQETEGAPRAIIFGQLCERPVVSTGGVGADGMVEPGTGSIVSPEHDPGRLAETIESYRRDPARRRREGAAGRRLASRRYDRRSVTEQWLGRLRTQAPA